MSWLWYEAFNIALEKEHGDERHQQHTLMRLSIRRPWIDQLLCICRNRKIISIHVRAIFVQTWSEQKKSVLRLVISIFGLAC